MDAATFFESFETIAEAPGGVAKLRELILELAVRGKLVPQDPGDEPAIEILESAVAITAHPSGARRSRKAKLLPPLSTVDAPFPPPSGWTWARLGDLGDWGAGATPPRSNPDFYGGNTPWFKSGELNDDLLITSEEFVTEKALQECSLRRNLPGDVLVAMYGATVGKVAILGIASTTNQAVCACTCRQGVFNRYLLILLKAIKRNLLDQREGGAQPNISKEKIISTVVLLPPAKEQLRIVAEVEKLMFVCQLLDAHTEQRHSIRKALHASSINALTSADTPEALAKAWARLRDHWEIYTSDEDSISLLRQAILQLAVQGKLVPQDAEERSRADLPLCCMTEQEAPYQIPDSWRWVRLQDVFEVMGGIQKTPSRAPRDNAYPYLRVANVQRGRLDLSEIEHFELAYGELERWRLHPNDLLIVEGNGSETEIGRCAIWSGEIPDCVHQNHIIRCRPRTENLSPYVQVFLNSPAGMQVMKSLAITTSGLFSLSVGRVRAIKLPIPPPEERQRITARVDELAALCLELRGRVQRQEAAAQTLATSAVHHISCQSRWSQNGSVPTP